MVINCVYKILNLVKERLKLQLVFVIRTITKIVFKR